MMANVRAELLLLRKRPATWILLLVAVVLSVTFSYAAPYAAYLGSENVSHFSGALGPLLPGQLISTVLGGFPFYFGVIALVLGVLVFGSEYQWDTFKTAFMQRPGMRTLLAAKLTALGAVLVLYVAANFVAGTAASLAIALREGAVIDWPIGPDIALAFAQGWLILALWTALGAMLGILTRGTSMAIALGIIYGLIVEPTFTAFANQISFIEDAPGALLRTNAYSLVAPLRDTAVVEAGPGVFSGPFVGTWQALGVIALYLAAFTGVSAWLLRHRDIN